MQITEQDYLTLECIDRLMRKNFRNPSLREIALELNITRGGALYRIKKLIELNAIEREKKTGMLKLKSSVMDLRNQFLKEYAKAL